MATKGSFAPATPERPRKPAAVPPLPARLQYLKPALEELLSLPPEEVNEDMDTSRLESVLGQRLEGMTLEEAEECLEGDNAALEEWLEGPRARRPFRPILFSRGSIHSSRRRFLRGN